MDRVTCLWVGSDGDLEAGVKGLVVSRESCRLVRSESIATAMTYLGREDVELVVTHLPTGDSEAELALLVRQLVRRRPAIPIIVLMEVDDLELRLRLLRLGVVDCIARPIDFSRLGFLVDILTVRARRQTAPAASHPRQGVEQDLTPIEDFIFPSGIGERLLKSVRAIASSEATVLLSGETGTGKTHLARVIHRLSPRSSSPFVVVQCGALSPTLFESELFGHTRGAFTGADRDNPGRFREARDGTVLLDDIDCVPLQAQTKLLRVVEDRLFEAVGSGRSQRVEARLIAATNRPLEKAVAAGEFRADLYHRLNVIDLSLPPLRSSRASIRSLAKKFLADHGRPTPADAEQRFATHVRGAPAPRRCPGDTRALSEPAGEGSPSHRLSSDALAALEVYDWPGNVRELRNAIERAAALSSSTVIGLDVLPERIVKAARLDDHTADSAPPDEADSGVGVEKNCERERVIDALRRNGNNRTRAASALGVSRVTLYKMLHRHQLI